jgi:hypothetical protein
VEEHSATVATPLDAPPGRPPLAAVERATLDSREPVALQPAAPRPTAPVELVNDPSVVPIRAKTTGEDRAPASQIQPEPAAPGVPTQAVVRLLAEMGAKDVTIEREQRDLGLEKVVRRAATAPVSHQVQPITPAPPAPSGPPVTLTVVPQEGAVLPRPSTLPLPEQSPIEARSPEALAIRVRIGSIDVRMSDTPSAKSRPAKPTAPPMSLDDYLQARSGRHR